MVLILASPFSHKVKGTQGIHKVVWSCTWEIWKPRQHLKNKVIFLLKSQNLFVLLMCKVRKTITSQFSTRQ